MKKNIFIIGLFLASFVLFANEMPEYKANYDSFLFKRSISKPIENGTFNKDALFTLEGNWAFLHIDNLKVKLVEKSLKGDILPDVIVPAKTKELFDENDIAYVNKKDYILVPSYYCDILKKQNRTLLSDVYEKHIQKISKYDDYTINSWYEPFYVNNYLKITNSIIAIGYGNGSSPNVIYDLNIISITRTSDGYEVIVANGKSINEFISDGSISLIEGWLTEKLPKYTDYRPYKLIIKQDGDYVFVYLNDITNLVQTFVKINNSTQSIIDSLIKTNRCDLSKVTWPRHADGSCDYDGSKKTAASQTAKESSSTNVAKNKTMTVNENLKLRSGEATSTQVLAVMQAGTKVKILELGKSETIDGINSNWVKVEIISGSDRDGNKLKSGITGWCYGGYLE